MKYQAFVVVEGRLQTPPPCQPTYGYPSHGDLQQHGEYAINHPEATVDWQIYLNGPDGNRFREGGRWFVDCGANGRIRASTATAQAMESLIATAP
jgi:hypothetical protein